MKFKIQKVKKFIHKKIEAMPEYTIMRLESSANLTVKRAKGSTISWYNRAYINGKQERYVIGNFPTTGIKAAEAIVAAHAELIEKGIDPREQDRRVADEIEWSKKSFAQVVDEYIAAKLISPGAQEKQKRRWRGCVSQKALKHETRITSLTRDQIIASLAEAAKTKWQTYKKVQEDVSGALNWAVLSEENLTGKIPQFPRGGLLKLIAEKYKIVEPETQGKLAVPLNHAHTFFKTHEEIMYKSNQPNSIGGEALLFLILTGVRVGEIMGNRPSQSEVDKAEAQGYTPDFKVPMMWKDVSLELGVWVIPRENMKMKDQKHVIPLSKQALQILQRVRKKAERRGLAADGDFVFHNYQRSKNGWNSENLFTHQLKQGPTYDFTIMKPDGTEVVENRAPHAHGFRKALTNFAARTGEFSGFVISKQLAHNPEHAKEDSSLPDYLDDLLFEDRRYLLQLWGDFLSKGKLPKNWKEDETADALHKMMQEQTKKKIDTTKDVRFDFNRRKQA